MHPTTTRTEAPTRPELLAQRAKALGLHGLAAHLGELAEPQLDWLERLLDWEEAERQQRSLERRLRAARLGAFKPLSDFDWSWPQSCDRAAIEELMTLRFLAEGVNVVLAGPNGVGKTMVGKNLCYQALRAGHTVSFVTAGQMLSELAGTESAGSLERRLRRYCRPRLLAVDELGYLSYGNRHADLLFEVVSRRYEAGRSVLVTTNKAFQEWNEIFPNAACVVTLVDRLVHRSEIVKLEGQSYRLKEARERASQRAAGRAKAGGGKGRGKSPGPPGERSAAPQ
jgi:DNA replication protein DnaC